MSVIRRSAKTTNFTVLDNDLVNDPALSFRALGLLVFLLSKPDNWTVGSEALSRTHSEGRDAVRTGLLELEQAGYMVRRKYRESGRYQTETVVYDTPQKTQGLGNNESTSAGYPTRLNRRGFPGPSTSTETKNGHQVTGGSLKRPRRVVRADDDTPSTGDEPEAFGASPRRKSTAERKEVAAKGRSGFGLALRMRSRLIDQGYAQPVNEKALTRQLNALMADGVTYEELEAAVGTFLSAPSRWGADRQAPWTAFLGHRTELVAASRGAARASRPAAEVYTDPYTYDEGA